ncbi:MAG: hypothetical protein C0623_13620 [Desulfuromonas sp.]|nr:MAG: hypothetical protein C0623_13620 [Desulfuromonas sp.]
MPNKPGEYEDIKPVMGLELKERLIAWRASMMDKHLPDVDKIPGLNGRPWDISKPLFQLCEMVKPEVKEDMCRVLLGLVEKKAESKRESIEGQIIAAIDCVAEFESVGQIIIPTGEILKEVNFDKSDRYKMSPQKLGKRLQSLGLNTEISGGYSRLYVSQDELNLLKEQYGLLECTESAADNDVNDDDLHEIEDTNMRVVESVESVGTIPTNKISGCGLQIEDNETNFWD